MLSHEQNAAPHTHWEKKLRRFLQAVMRRRGVGSNYNLLVASIQLKLKMNWTVQSEVLCQPSKDKQYRTSLSCYKNFMEKRKEVV